MTPKDSVNIAKQPHSRETDLRRGYEAGKQALLNSARNNFDPVGSSDEHGRLRAMGRWRFILLRGVVGFAVPMFIWIVISDFREDIRFAQQFKGSVIQHLLYSWIFAFCMSAFLGVIVGFLAWRRLTSDFWPKTKADPESTLTRIDPL